MRKSSRKRGSIAKETNVKTLSNLYDSKAV